MTQNNIFIENGEMYHQSFLFNNEMNDAGDPINFKIYPENSKKIAKSFIGRPYLLPEKDSKGRWINRHIRADSLPVLFNKQKKFAIGEIVRTPYNPETGNYNAITKIFPEYHQFVRDGKLPAATSPMLAQSDSYIDDEGKMHVKDGIGVHLQGLPKGGYRPELSEIMSVCEAGLDQCMTELKTVAAAGELIAEQENDTDDKHSFIGQNDESKVIMSQEMTQQPAPPGAAPQAPPGAPQDTEKRIAMIEQVIADLSKQLQMILQKLGGGQTSHDPNTPPMVGAASDLIQPHTVEKVPEAVAKLQSELQSLKDDRVTEQEALQKERNVIFLKERMRIATEIVETKIKLHKTKIEEKEAEITKLVELKDGETYLDLTLLHEELTSSLKLFVGAAGTSVTYEVPELGATNETEPDKMSGHDIMERFNI